jgi:hypothetical protein
MKCDIDSIQRCFKSEQKENLEESKNRKIGDKSDTLNKKYNHPNQDTRLVNKDYPHSVTNFDTIEPLRLELDNNIVDLQYEISKKNNKNYASNSKLLLQKLFLLVKYTFKRIKNDFNVSHLLQGIQSVVSTYSIWRNNMKGIDEVKAEEQIEIETKSGHRIKVIQNLSSGFDRLVITNYHTMNKTGQNNPEQNTNSITIDLSQNSVLLSTETSLSIKASTVNIEASESMNLKSGSVMTINGSLVRIN